MCRTMSQITKKALREYFFVVLSVGHKEKHLKIINDIHMYLLLQSVPGPTFCMNILLKREGTSMMLTCR